MNQFIQVYTSKTMLNPNDNASKGQGSVTLFWTEMGDKHLPPSLIQCCIVYQQHHWLDGKYGMSAVHVTASNIAHIVDKCVIWFECILSEERISFWKIF